MNYIWIEEQGCADAAQLSKKLLELCGENHLYLAYFTDSFTSGNMSGIEMEKLSVDKLLEIRIFSDEMEFLARRSRPGKNRKIQRTQKYRRRQKLAAERGDDVPDSVSYPGYQKTVIGEPYSLYGWRDLQSSIKRK